jgi:hypothetical protein
MQMITSNA